MTELPEAPDPLGVPTTDAHTHLGSTTRKTGLNSADAVARARAVGVHWLVDVGYDAPSSVAAIAAVEGDQIEPIDREQTQAAVELG